MLRMRTGSAPPPEGRRCRRALERVSSHFKKLKIDDLLFVEYKCLVDEVKAGIWSDTNYFVFVTSGKKMWKSIYNEYMVQPGDSLFVKKGANLVHQYFDEDYCALMVFISDDFIKKFVKKGEDLQSQEKSFDAEQQPAAVSGLSVSI